MGLNDYYFGLQQMNIGTVPSKRVCINHFFEASINNFIRKNYNDGYCDYCSRVAGPYSMRGAHLTTGAHMAA